MPHDLEAETVEIEHHSSPYSRFNAPNTPMDIIGARADALKSPGNALHFLSDMVASGASGATASADSLAAQLAFSLLDGTAGLRLRYQPLVRAKDNSLFGFEALLRRTTAEGVAIPPQHAVALASANGFAAALDFWVLQRALRDTAPWLRLRKARGMQLAINLSAALLGQPQALPAIRAACNAAGIAPTQLVLELGEDDIFGASEVHCMADLAVLGFQLAVDDFGRGHADVRRFEQVPARLVKLDMSFFNGRQYQARELEAVLAVVRWLRLRQLIVVAEGMAGPADLRLARQLGCHVLQGFWFSEAVSADAAAAMVLEGNLPWSDLS